MTWATEAADLATDLAFWYVGQTDPDYPIEQMGQLSMEQARKFRALGIMHLLGEGSTDLFLHSLMRAARTRELYLQRVRAESYDDLFFAASGRFEPLLDAIAADDLRCARSIAVASAPTLQPGEYQDDHHYALALHALIAAPADLAQATRELDAMEAFLAGEASPRLDTLRAIVLKDQSRFDLTFASFIAGFEASVEQARARHQHEDGVVLALREVSVEGLALLRLAEQSGVATEREYPFCPSLARRPMRAPFREV